MITTLGRRMPLDLGRVGAEPSSLPDFGLWPISQSTAHLTKYGLKLSGTSRRTVFILSVRQSDMRGFSLSI